MCSNNANSIRSHAARTSTSKKKWVSTRKDRVCERPMAISLPPPISRSINIGLGSNLTTRHNTSTRKRNAITAYRSRIRPKDPVTTPHKLLHHTDTNRPRPLPCPPTQHKQMQHPHMSLWSPSSNSDTHVAGMSLHSQHQTQHQHHTEHRVHHTKHWTHHQHHNTITRYILLFSFCENALMISAVGRIIFCSLLTCSNNRFCTSLDTCWIGKSNKYLTSTRGNCPPLHPFNTILLKSRFLNRIL